MSHESPTSLYPEFDAVDVVALTTLNGFGPSHIRAHVARIRSESRKFDDGFGRELVQARSVARGHLAEAKRIGARCIVDGEADYPDALRALENPPVAIWVMGDVSIMHSPPAVSIVGTRTCTAYGERVTRDIAMAFARSGAVVVSGMAVGIDAMAHRATLETNGRTIAVLGTGVDVPYPAAHRRLHAEIVAKGLVVSESPPAARAIKGCFPRRNRIIAALGTATIVVEAGVASGALNTAEHAQAIGKELGVVPGPIDSAASSGSNLLMRDGWNPICSVADALSLLQLSQPRRVDAKLETVEEQAVWKALVQPASDFDVLCARTLLPSRVLFETVTALEMRGLVECSLTGELRRR